MGASSSKPTGKPDLNAANTRGQAITGAARAKAAEQRTRPDDALSVESKDFPFAIQALQKLLVFSRTDPALLEKVVQGMWQRECDAGEILIKQGDTGLAASELYIIQSGEFEILENRGGINLRVNTKGPGEIFGEVALMYNSPRNATVAAIARSRVFVLERAVFRAHVQETAETEGAQVELFLNSVPILQKLSAEERRRVAGALEEVAFEKGARVVQQGDPGDLFYIIKEGEAVVYQETTRGTRLVNRLFKSDFFGEKALLQREPRMASVEAASPRLVCLTLRRDVFTNLLGDLQEIMSREKSPQVVSQRLQKLQTKGAARHSAPAWVHIKRRRKSRKQGTVWEVVHAKGHYDEVCSLSKEPEDLPPESPEERQLDLIEGKVLGGGAFSRVSKVVEETTQRQYALKRMRKATVLQCPEHVYCEQHITRNLAHPFCIRQYASFQDKHHLYFLFDLLPGGDLMDILVAEAQVITHKNNDGFLHLSCFSTKQRVLKGMDEGLGRFYVASIVLALEYLHSNNIVYRDLKPENVFIDHAGYVKLGDFGFAKALVDGNKTFTFCGTPGYVSPENILAHGYNFSVDWWGLGVLMFVLLTGRQPFSSPRTEDPMIVMRRIVDESFQINYPPYLSSFAKDLIGRLLERKPALRIGMQSGGAGDIKRHPWFNGFDWDALDARRLTAPRAPKNDSEKRIQELQEAEDGEPKPTEDPAELAECELVFADF